MNNFSLDRLFDPEWFVDDQIDRLKPRTRALYNDWILDLRKGKTFFGLNWNWPDNFDSDPGPDYDTYVFSWHVESWPHQWLKNFCESHSDSQVVVIGEFPLPKKYYDLPNLKCLVYHCWSVLITEVLQFDQPAYVSMSQRKHLLSSLVNKPSYFKALATAHLLLNHSNKDLIFSWNINKRKEQCSSMSFLEMEHLPNPELQKLFEFYQQELKHKTYALDEFNDSRLAAYFCDIPAYTDCLINVTNETYSQSFINKTVLPGPFLTEKTWKPLLSGCALLSQGPRGVYGYLEKFGFVFDYPWDKTFDCLHGDIDRFVAFLDCLDSVMQMDPAYLAGALQSTTKYNYEHIRSSEFFSNIKKINDANLEEFLKA